MFLQRAAASGRDALLRIVAAGPHITQAIDASLAQRLQSHSDASTSQQAHMTPAAGQQQQQQPHLCSSSCLQCSDVYHQPHCSSSTAASQQQQQQHPQWTHQQKQPHPLLKHQQHPSSSSSSSSPWSFHSTRAYADSANSSSSSGSLGRRRRAPGFGSGGSGSSGRPGLRGGGGGDASGLRVPVSAVLQQLGRRPEWCAPTEALGSYELHDHGPDYDPFKDRRREVLQPRQVDGVSGFTADALEDTLLSRQQIESSALPTALKRAELVGGRQPWEELLLKVKRTVKVTKGGKVETLHALVAVGNADGLIGVGEHSGKNIQKVAMDALLKAYKNVVAVPRYRQHTVYHMMDVKNRKVRMRVWPRRAGFGVTASPLVSQLCALVGIRDVTIKLTGRRKNTRNVVHTFVEGLLGQSVPHDGVEGSGVYMREVFHSRTLPCGLKRGVHVP